MSAFRSPLVRGLLVLLALLTMAIVSLQLPPVKRALGRMVAAEIQARAGIKLSIDSAQLQLTGVRLSGLKFEGEGSPPLSFTSLTIYPRISALLDRRIEVRAMSAQGMTLILPARDRIASELALESPTPPSTESRREKIARYLDPGGFEFTLDKGEILWGNATSPRATLPLKQLEARWDRPGSKEGSVEVTVESPGQMSGVKVTASSLSEGNALRIRVAGPGFALEPFRPGLGALLPPAMLERISPLLDKVAELPVVGGDFEVRVDRSAETIQLEGKVAVQRLSIQDERLASVPVGPLSLTQNVVASARLSPLEVEVQRWDGQLSDAPYYLTAWLKQVDDHYQASVTAAFKDTPYQKLLEAIPSHVAPALDGVRLAGTLDMSVHAEVDTSDLEKMVTEFTSDFSRLRLEQPSRTLQGPEPLVGFHYKPVSRDGVVREFILGRGQPGWVPIEHIPKTLINALLLSEDITFFQHEGFDVEGLKRALKANLRAGKAVRGGSTITQQLAKNLFLARERTALRKLQEAVLAWQLEQVLTKPQILEAYLNIIEWGPGIYGVSRAAQHYFGKAVGELNAKEAAYLCTIIPNPIRYYMYFQRGELTERWSAHLQGLLDRMRAFERISEDDYYAASLEPLYFRGSPRAAVDVLQMEAEDAAEARGPTDEEDPMPVPLPIPPDDRLPK